MYGCMVVCTGVLFRLQVSKRRDNFALKMGVKFAASLDIGVNLC